MGHLTLESRDIRSSRSSCATSTTNGFTPGGNIGSTAAEHLDLDHAVGDHRSPTAPIATRSATANPRNATTSPTQPAACCQPFVPSSS
jgi:hypothetical protein